MLFPEFPGSKTGQAHGTSHYQGDAGVPGQLAARLAAEKISCLKLATAPGRQHWHLQKGWGSVLFRARQAEDLSGLVMELTPAPGILRRASSRRLQKKIENLLELSGARPAPPPSGA